MNMVLSDVEETIYIVDAPQEGQVVESVVRTVKRQADMLFVRGDGGQSNSHLPKSELAMPPSSFLRGMAAA